MSSEGEREGVRGRGRERMGKERDAKRSRSSDKEEPRCGALFIGGGGISEWCSHYLWVAS